MHKNNFDFLRLLFATLVIITHSYALLGLGENDLFMQTSQVYPFSYLAVRGFFVVSGYLIFQSLMRSSSLKSYFWNRFLRLFPGLLVVLVLTVILGSLAYQGNFQEYFGLKSVYTYIPNNLSLFFLQYPLADGVFGSNPHLNGSLWTLRYEFTMYCCLVVFYFIKNKQMMINWILLFLTPLLLAGIYLLKNELLSMQLFQINGFKLFELGSFFISGSLLASISINEFRYKNMIFSFSLVIFIIFTFINKLDLVIYIVYPLIVILFGLYPLSYISNLTAKIGDLSYGIYIYAMPIQHALIYYFHPSINELIIYTTIIVYILAYLSWHLIEKNALKYKKIFSKQKTA